MGDRKAEGDRRRTRSRAGAERRMAPVRLCCLARNGHSPGEESRSGAVAAQAIEAQSPSGQIKPERGRVARATRTASSGEDVADVGCPSQAARRGRRRERNPGVGKGRRRPPRLGHRVLLPASTGRQASRQISPRMEEVQRPGRYRSCSCPADPEGHSSYQDELGQLNPSCSRPSATAVPNPTVEAYRSRAGPPGGSSAPRPCRRRGSRR